MKTGALVTSLAPATWRTPGVPLRLFRAMFIARDLGMMVFVRVHGEVYAVAVDVYALAALDAAFGVA